MTFTIDGQTVDRERNNVAVGNGQGLREHDPLVNSYVCKEGNRAVRCSCLDRLLEIYVLLTVNLCHICRSIIHSIYRSGVCLGIGSGSISNVNTVASVGIVENNIYIRVTLDGKILTCSEEEAFLDTVQGNSRICNRNVTVLATQIETTFNIGNVESRILNYNTVAVSVIADNSSQAGSCCVGNGDAGAVEQFNCSIGSAIDADQIGTGNAGSANIDIIKDQRLVFEHPEHSSAGFDAGINYDGTVFERGSTKVQVVLGQGQGFAIQIDDSCLRDRTLAGQCGSCISQQGDGFALICSCEGCIDGCIPRIANFCDIGCGNRAKYDLRHGFTVFGYHRLDNVRNFIAVFVDNGNLTVVRFFCRCSHRNHREHCHDHTQCKQHCKNSVLHFRIPPFVV